MNETDVIDLEMHSIESHPIPGTLSFIQLDIVCTTYTRYTEYTYIVTRTADRGAGITEVCLSSLPSRDTARTVASLLHREALCLSSHN